MEGKEIEGFSTRLTKRTTKIKSMKTLSESSSAIHTFIHRKYKKGKLCEICGEEKRLDWSHKTHNYSRKREEWQAICRKCHIEYDRKLLKIKDYEKVCKNCSKRYTSHEKKGKYCSEKCKRDSIPLAIRAFRLKRWRQRTGVTKKQNTL